MVKAIRKVAEVDTLATKRWQKRRPEQGYTFAEVAREIHRRARGEYVLPMAAREQALRDGERFVEIHFKLSALLSDFLRDEQLSSEELIALLDCNAGDTINFALDPFPRPVEDAHIACDTLIDAAYPGKHMKFARD